MVNYKILDRDGEKANVVLNLDTVIFEVKLIASRISVEENLESFLLFNTYDSYKNYFSSWKEGSSNEGYLGKYVNGNFLTPLVPLNHL